MKIRPWQLGNTTVRNPFRLKDGLECLISTGFEGRMTKEYEEEIAQILGRAGVIKIKDDTSDITSSARKWRGALVKMGFLWPCVKTNRIKNVIQDDIGDPFSLTENGRRLLNCNSLRAENEVFQRALVALRFPNPLENEYSHPTFSPLKNLIDLLDNLSLTGLTAYISNIEMASEFLFYKKNDDIHVLLNKITKYRLERQNVTAVRKFDNNWLDISANGNKVSTLLDYQDTAFRYFKATGLFHSYKRGITTVEEHHTLLQLIDYNQSLHLTDAEYIIHISNGGILPFDNKEDEHLIIEELIHIAKHRDIPNLSDLVANNEDLSIQRHNLEEAIQRSKENDYGNDQINWIDEIVAYLKMIQKNKLRYEFGETELKIPKSERPAYFEWIIWRLILAFNHLSNHPSNVRQFKVDQDFMPISTAPGRGPDLIAEYQNFVLAIEVTLTENSRQEAAEGEPVRRHVADLIDKFEPLGKPVYGLFISRKTDTNTAETFRLGIWYKHDDSKISLDVVPIQLDQLIPIIESAIESNHLNPAVFLKLIQDILTTRFTSIDAPTWKQSIKEIAKSFEFN